MRLEPIYAPALRRLARHHPLVGRRGAFAGGSLFGKETSRLNAPPI
jgi:hypothetical protein